MELKLPKVAGNSETGKFLKLDKENFMQIVSKDNIADYYARIDMELEQKIQLGKDLKALIDVELKNLKSGQKKLRDFTTAFMAEKELEKVTGTLIKSINYYPAKDEVKKEVEVQIKKGREYINLDSLTKEDLVEMLKAKGVKTREVPVETTKHKPATIRVVR
jgi:hypothetical protein